MQRPALSLALWASLLGALAPVSKACGAERDVAIDGGKAALHGTLTLPDAAPRVGAAVLMISGSGPTDRDGNSSVPGVKPASQKLLAQALAAQGIASLRFDKRGIAASAAAAPAESQMRFGIYVDDAVAWAQRLAEEPGVACVVIAGHSEGALLAAMAARRTPVCGVIELAGAGRTADVVIAEQVASAPEPLKGRVLSALAELKAGRPVADPPIPALFRPSIQPYMMSWLPLDPAEELGHVTAPVLILQGDRDIQVSVADAKALKAGQPRARLVVLNGVSHILKPAPADRAANAATYADPALPLDARVIEEIAAFTKAASPG